MRRTNGYARVDSLGHDYSQLQSDKKLVVMNDKTRGENTVEAAEVKCLLPREEDRGEGPSIFYVRAKAYVIACGAVATAQVSMFRLVVAFHGSSNDTPKGPCELTETQGRHLA